MKIFRLTGAVVMVLAGSIGPRADVRQPFNSPPIVLQPGSTGDISTMNVTAAGTTRTLPFFVQALPLGVDAKLSDLDLNVRIERDLIGTETSNRSERERSAFNNLLRYDLLLPSNAWYGIGAAGYNNGTFYGFRNPARGSVQGWRTMQFIGAGADDAAGRASGEISIGSGFINVVSQLANKNMAVWGLDLGMAGPASNVAGAQEATFTGLSYQLHKMTPGNAWVLGTGAKEGADYKRPSVGIHLLSYPRIAYNNKIDYGRSGLDDSPAGVKTYPLDVVYAASGCSGAIETVMDCDNAAATPMANSVFRMGGTPPGPYVNPGTNAPSKSRFLNGFEFSDYTGIAAWFRAKHGAADANTRSIKVEAAAGPVEVNAATTFGGSVTMSQSGPVLTLDDLGASLPDQRKMALLMYQGDFFFQRQTAAGAGLVNMMQLTKDGSSVIVSSKMIEPNGYAPASSTSPCTQGQHGWDGNYEYRCILTNTWKRTALSTW